MKVGTIVGFQNPAQWRRPWGHVYAGTLNFAARADELGFDTVWLTEHHFADDGYCPALMPVAGAIAARTTRIRIGTKVLLLPFHNPLRLAEDIAVVDLISDGRLDIGVAAGYRKEEFAGFQIDHADRSSRTREGISVLRKALSGEEFSHSGRYYHYGPVAITPPPVQIPLPLWVGGRSEGPIKRAAKAGYHLQLADFDLDLCARDLQIYVEALRSAGRDPADFEVAAVASVFVDEDGDRARQLSVEHMQYQMEQYVRWFAASGDRDVSMPAGLPDGCIAGTPDEVRAIILEAHERVPFTHFSFWTLLPGMDPTVAGRSLELFATEVLPALHAAPSS